MTRRRVGVVVGLLLGGVVVGLGVTAVNRVRDAADRSKCLSNLKQLGIGFQAYADALNGPLPPLTDQGQGAPTGRGLPSWFATMIPYMEQTHFRFQPESPPSVYNAPSSTTLTYRDKSGDPHSYTGGMANQAFPVFIDPNDHTAGGRRDVPMTLPDGSVGYYATGSYAANGLLPWGKRDPAVRTLASLGNTILIAERPQVCRDAGGAEVFNLWGLGVYSPHMPAFATLTPDDLPGLASTGQVAPVVPLPADDPIRVRVGRLTAAPELPDFDVPFQVLRRDQPCEPRRPGTPHRAGMQVLMGDGSIRVFAPDTAPRVFWAACVPPGAAGP